MNRRKFIRLCGFAATALLGTNLLASNPKQPEDYINGWEIDTESLKTIQSSGFTDEYNIVIDANGNSFEDVYEEVKKLTLGEFPVIDMSGSCGLELRHYSGGITIRNG